MGDQLELLLSTPADTPELLEPMRTRPNVGPDGGDGSQRARIQAPLRTIRFNSTINELLVRSKRAEPIFIVDELTVGVADGGLAREIISRRGKHKEELSVFKPINDRQVDRSLSAELLKALGRDVRRLVASDARSAQRLDGSWPPRGFAYLKDALFGSDSRALRSRVVDLSSPTARLLARCRLQAEWHPARSQGQGGSKVGAFVGELAGADQAMAFGLYQRVASAVCSTVSVLATNAAWLACPIPPDADLDAIILETLRLLPPAWTLLRRSDSAFLGISPLIGPDTQTILIYPLLMQRRPDVWPQADEFRPDRWKGVTDPDALEHYLPFGMGGDRCTAKHLILQLAKHVLEMIRAQNLSPSSSHRSARVPLSPFLSVRPVKLAPAWPSSRKSRWWLCQQRAGISEP
jgi:cytochrome P450